MKTLSNVWWLSWKLLLQLEKQEFLKTTNTQLNGFPKTAGRLRKNLQEIVNPGTFREPLQMDTSSFRKISMTELAALWILWASDNRAWDPEAREKKIGIINKRFIEAILFLIPSA